MRSGPGTGAEIVPGFVLLPESWSLDTALEDTTTGKSQLLSRVSSDHVQNCHGRIIRLAS